MSANIPRFMVAAPASGSGKTTITCGLLRILAEEGMRPLALKCGPDYIDPQFHARVSGLASGNLDSFFTSEDTCRSLLVRAVEEAQAGCAVLEGVMGFYDGLMGGGTTASSYDIARITQTPVIMVMPAQGASLTLAALVKGLSSFREDAPVAGVILNHCSPALAARLSPMIEQESGVRVLGCLPHNETLRLDSRHLGLVSPLEIPELQDRIGHVAELLRKHVDIPAFLDIARGATPLDCEPYRSAPATASQKPVRIAVAHDSAFSFYYAENLRMLRDMGAELVPFSPLADKALSADICGVYLGGGYPELHAGQLAQNLPMKEVIFRAVRSAQAGGMPLIAECGGFMYLQESIDGEEGTRWPMVGALPGAAHNEGKLHHFGYVTITAGAEGLLGPEGTKLPAHEFHYWHSTHEGEDCKARKPTGGDPWPCMRVEGTLLAGYPHIYFPAHPQLAQNFILAAERYRQSLNLGRATDLRQACL